MKKKTVLSISLALVMLLSGCSGIIGNNTVTDTDRPTTTFDATEKPTTNQTTTQHPTTTTNSTNNSTTDYPDGINESGVSNYIKLYENHLRAVDFTKFQYRKITTMSDTETVEIVDSQIKYTVNNNSSEYILKEGYLNERIGKFVVNFYAPQFNGTKYQKQQSLITNQTIYRSIDAETKREKIRELLFRETLTEIAPSFDLDIKHIRDDGTIVLDGNKTSEISWLSNYTDQIDNPQSARLSLKVTKEGFVNGTWLFIEGEKRNVTIQEELIIGDKVNITVPQWLEDVYLQDATMEIDSTGSYIKIDYKSGVNIEESLITVTNDKGTTYDGITNANLTEGETYYIVFSENSIELKDTEPSTYKYSLPDSKSFDVNVFGKSAIVFMSQTVGNVSA